MDILLLDYAIGAAVVFCIWLKFFLDYSDFPQKQHGSWTILILASLLWPITVPISMIELVVKKTRKLRW